MGKTELMAIASILKFILAFAGIIASMVLLGSGLATKDNKKLKKAGLVFLGTWVILIVLGAIEFFFLSTFN